MNKKDLTVAILAGGNSARFNSEKALAEFRGRALLTHMIDIAKQLSPTVLIVVSSENQAKALEKTVNDGTIVIDPDDSVKSALTGAVTAFEYTETKYTLLLPIDTPLASVKLLKALIHLIPGHGAVVPTWPSGYLEPLHSIYLAEHAYIHGMKSLDNGKYRMRNLLDSLSNVLNVSTDVLKEFDPELNTFVNMNTSEDLQSFQSGTSRMN
ncbi:MAG: molybdenum cofactor guanylyltransferase [Candidatus Thorarchaeota archaeon]|jgi:molybdopterin-guanine dinucleotide biosynthesis protein A